MNRPLGWAQRGSDRERDQKKDRKYRELLKWCSEIIFTAQGVCVAFFKTWNNNLKKHLHMWTSSQDNYNLHTCRKMRWCRNICAWMILKLRWEKVISLNIYKQISGSYLCVKINAQSSSACVNIRKYFWPIFRNYLANFLGTLKSFPNFFVYGAIRKLVERGKLRMWEPQSLQFV